MSAKVTAKAISQVQNQIPQFITEEFPLYEKFLKHYYDFLETLCIYFNSIDGYTSEFTVGETVTGITTGATATVKATGAYTGFNKLFLEPTNDINFILDENIVGSTSESRVSIEKLNRKPLNASKTFSDLTDSDKTSEGILKSFKKELYPNIRDDANANLRFFLKHIKKFYRAKGSEKSFRTIFRVLFGQENLDFYYPKEDLFKISDGNWNQDVVLQISYDAAYLNFNGLTITGGISTATAFVSNVTTRKLGTIPIIELVLTQINGTFQVGEEISATTGEGADLLATLTGMLSDVTITNAGNGYEIGDAITITDPTYVGFGATAEVSDTTNDQTSTINITNVGNGYQVDDIIVFDNAETNVDVTAEAKVATLANTFTQDVITSQIFEAVTTKSFNILTSFGVTVLEGYLVGNAAIYANATKKGEVVFQKTNFTVNAAFSSNPASTNILTNNSAFASATKKFTVSYYDSTLKTVIGQTTLGSDLENTDRVYLFDSDGTAIDISSTVLINSLLSNEIRIYDVASETEFVRLEDSISGLITLETGTPGQPGNIINEDVAPAEFVTGDAVHLFTSAEATIAGATSTLISDTSIINPSSDINFNSTNFYADNIHFNKTIGTYARVDNTITATVSTGHNLAEQFTINNAFSTDPIATDILTDSDDTTLGGQVELETGTGVGLLLQETGTGTGYILSEDSATKEFTVTRYESATKTVYGYSTLGTFSNGNTVHLYDSTGATARDVDGGTAINSTLTVGSLTIDMTSGQLSGGGADDGVSHTIATTANSTVFTFPSLSGTGAASGALSLLPNANNTIKNSLQVAIQTFGTINSISVTSYGSGYESAPSLSVTNDFYNNLFQSDDVHGGYYGKNAVLTVATPLGGQITEVTVTEPGFGYADAPTLTLAGSSDGTATVTGALAVTRTKPGKFVGESGFPSSQKKVQDNDYYQDFSYVLKTTDSVDIWRQDVLKLLHPAGLKLFGEVSIQSVINSQMFDRALNNINSVDPVTGLQQYRAVTFELVSINLGLSTISAEVEMNKEVEYQLEALLTNYLGWNSVLSLGTTFYSVDATCDTVINSKPITMDDTSAINVGMKVTGTGIAADTIVATVDNPTRITLSINATANGTNVTLSFSTVPATGNFLTNSSTFANASKKFVVTRFDSLGDKVYGRNIQGYAETFRNGDKVFLFDSAGTAIDIATAVYISKNDIVQEDSGSNDRFLMEGSFSGQEGHILYEGQDPMNHHNREYGIQIEKSMDLSNSSTTDFTIIDPDNIQRPVLASVEVTTAAAVEVTFDDDEIRSALVTLGTPADNVDLDLVSLFNSSMGIPAEMFGLMSVKTTSGFTAGSSTVFTTSATHFFQDNAEVYLDGYEGTAASMLNKKKFRVSNVGAGNSTSVTLIDEEYTGMQLETASGGGEVLLEDGVAPTSVMPLYDGTNSTEGSMLSEFTASAIDTTGLTITTHGKIYKPGKHMTSGILINLFEDEYIGDYSTQVIDNYEHNSPADMTTFSVGNVIDITPTRLDIESSVILETTIGEDLLLEDGTTNSPTSSAIGKVLADEGTLDIDSTYDDWELMINAPEQKQIAGIENNTIEFNRVFDYRDIPYENNFGFAYYKHRVEKRVAHVGNP